MTPESVIVRAIILTLMEGTGMTIRRGATVMVARLLHTSIITTSSSGRRAHLKGPATGTPSGTRTMDAIEVALPHVQIMDTQYT
jgi:hypothetical protein